MPDRKPQWGLFWGEIPAAEATGVFLCKRVGAAIVCCGHGDLTRMGKWNVLQFAEDVCPRLLFP